MEGKEDPDNRRDFPGGFPDDTRSAFTAQGRTATERRMFEWTRAWLRLRAEHSSLRQGRLIDLFYDNDVYVFARQHVNETVIIAINRGAQEKKIAVPAAAIGLRGNSQAVGTIGSNETATFANETATLTLPPRTASAYVVR